MIQKIINELEETFLSVTKAYKENYKLEPCIAIINTNVNDEPSQRYIRNKRKKCEDYGIKTTLHEPTNMEELYSTISNLNANKQITSIIIQYPFAKWIDIPQQRVFDLVSPEKDIDRLHSCWYYDKDVHNLPLTAFGIYKIIETLFFENKLKFQDKILFNGNGITTNKRLFLKMFDEGRFDCRIINSKTPKHSVRELTHWAHLIVSGIGKKDSLDIEGKYVICPSIIKNEDGTFSSDLKDEQRDKNITHKVIGGIGKLTTSSLLMRAFEDARKQLKK